VLRIPHLGSVQVKFTAHRVEHHEHDTYLLNRAPAA